jgi:ABC-type phosphate/phosphonate transport system permease subunit
LGRLKREEEKKITDKKIGKKKALIRGLFCKKNYFFLEAFFVAFLATFLVAFFATFFVAFFAAFLAIISSQEIVG